MAIAAGPFDVVEVMRRAATMQVPGAPVTALMWADRAADQLGGWVDAFQALVQHEMTLPRPLPPLDEPPAPAPTGGDDEAPAGSPADAAGNEAAEGNRPAGDDEALPSLGGAPKPEESAWERERKARRSELLAEVPLLAEALRAGRITTGHVDTLANALCKLPDAIRDRVVARGRDLLAEAVACTPEQFTRRISRLVAKAFEDAGVDLAAAQRARSALRRGADKATGMHFLHLDIDPERGGRLFDLLDAEREAIFHGGHHKGLTREQVELQALLNLVARPAAAAEPSDAGDKPVLGTRKSSTKKVRGLVLIDVESLLHGEHSGTVCETGSGVPLPIDTVRRLMCIAEVAYGLTINGRIVGHVANSELATPEQRDRLRGMYRTCCWPGCERPFDQTEIHHIIFRSRDGPTDISWLVPLCVGCHDKVHHDGWALTIDAERTLTVTAPDGTVTSHPFVPLADLDQLRLFDPPAA